MYHHGCSNLGLVTQVRLLDAADPAARITDDMVIWSIAGPGSAEERFVEGAVVSGLETRVVRPYQPDQKVAGNLATAGTPEKWDSTPAFKLQDLRAGMVKTFKGFMTEAEFRKQDVCR